jgi:acyl-CoA synthetase (AMP-forming)/AMP-acid ligase II
MLGYWGDPGATSRILKDGWLNTGDLARLDENGFFKLCGRANGLVKIQGYRFHPCEVEQLLARRLNDVQLVATPVDLNGRTRLALFARSRSDRLVTANEIRQACLQLLPRHMMPHRYEIVDDWPLNSAHKIDRLALCSRLSATRPPETPGSLTCSLAAD